MVKGGRQVRVVGKVKVDRDVKVLVGGYRSW